MKRLIFALERFTGSEGVFDSMKAINLFPVVRGSEGESKSQLPAPSVSDNFLGVVKFFRNV